MALIGSLSRVRAKSFWPADRAKIGTRAKIDGDGAGGGSEGRSATLALLRLSRDAKKKIKLKILSFYFHQVKEIFEHISVDLSSAR